MKRRLSIWMWLIAFTFILIPSAEIFAQDTDVCIHEWNTGEITKEATCIQAGVKTYTCLKCNATKTENIPALGHSYDEGVVTKEPDCISIGIRTYTCAKCNSTKTEIIPALGHEKGECVVVKEATCTEGGEIYYICSRCNKKCFSEYTGNLDHDLQLIGGKEPTFTEEGYNIYKCSRCSYTQTFTVARKPTMANEISVKDRVKLGYSAKSQKYSIGATCKSGAAFTYKSSNPALKIDEAGIVTIPAKYMGVAVITFHCDAIPAASGKDAYSEATGYVWMDIGPAKPSLSSVKNVKGGKLQIKWKKDKVASGYELVVSYDPEFNHVVKRSSITKNKITSKTFKKLEKGKTCYVRIRGYKKTSTGTPLGPWSNVKKVIIKK